MVQPTVLHEPLKFKPILQSRIWGGDGLYRLLGKGEADVQDIGESWELSDREDNASRIAGGAFSGHSFRRLFSLHARDILGAQYVPDLARFPLLHKFIHARDNLSVQVHPGEGSPLGEAKTECWYILEAPEDAGLIVGIRGDGNRDAILSSLRSRECQDVLNRIPVRPGDLFFIPAGTVHAITAGILLYEVQQNSDTTFRLYDWDRLDASGKSRPLHLQEAAEVVDFRRHDKHRIKPLSLHLPARRDEVLVACAHFALVKHTRCVSPSPLGNRNRFRVLTCVKGGFDLFWNGGHRLPIGLGETVLVPAACPHPALQETREGSEMLSSFLPVLDKEIVAPLLAAGHSPADIRDLGGIDGIPVQKLL